jgi:hypothetical protein
VPPLPRVQNGWNAYRANRAAKLLPLKMFRLWPLRGSEETKMGWYGVIRTSPLL